MQKPIIYAIIMDQVTRQHKLAVHHVESPESQLDQLQSSVIIYQDLCQIIVHNFSFYTSEPLLNVRITKGLQLRRYKKVNWGFTSILKQ